MTSDKLPTTDQDSIQVAELINTTDSIELSNDSWDGSMLFISGETVVTESPEGDYSKLL